jgi:hypothetical protein
LLAGGLLQDAVEQNLSATKYVRAPATMTASGKSKWIDRRLASAWTGGFGATRVATAVFPNALFTASISRGSAIPPRDISIGGSG